MAEPEPTRPLTGAEYVESLRDDREIYLYGERVKDVTEHPAFRNPVRMTARLYDALHDPKQRDVLTCPTDAGGPEGYTHPFYTTPRSAEDLVASQRAIAGWARMSYGWMGRSPDYKASFLGTLGANASTRPAKLRSAKSAPSAASFMMKMMSSGARRGLTVWQTAPMPEIA